MILVKANVVPHFLPPESAEPLFWFSLPGASVFKFDGNDCQFRSF